MQDWNDLPNALISSFSDLISKLGLRPDAIMESSEEVFTMNKLGLSCGKLMAATISILPTLRPDQG